MHNSVKGTSPLINMDYTTVTRMTATHPERQEERIDNVQLYGGKAGCLEKDVTARDNSVEPRKFRYTFLQYKSIEAHPRRSIKQVQVGLLPSSTP